MRYLVTVQAKAYVTQEVVVEASSENEASLSACKIAADGPHDFVPGSFDVISINEAEKPTEKVKAGVPFEGYLRNVI